MTDETRRSSPLVILIGLLIALGAAELPVTRFLAPQATLTGHIEREAFFWAVTLIVILYILVVERRPLSSIGLGRPTWRTLAFGIAGGVVLTVGFGLFSAVILPFLHLHMNDRAMTSLIRTPLWFRVLLVLRAAVFEEICYRGHTIERVIELTGSRWIAALVSIAAFTVAHVGFWGWTGQLLAVAFAAIVLAGLYLWRRDLPANMLAHFITDGVGLFFG
jgi:membrane protease YdiL (CAAX protease family)